MLYLIGLGLNSRDISLNALDAIKKCKKLYLENYTSFGFTKKELEKIIKKKVIIAGRELIENKASIILKEAKKKDIGLLIYGDPLSATTHINCLIDSKKEDGFLKLFRSGQIRLLDILGYFPETDLCKACGGDLNVNNFSAFNHVLGGIVCKKCFLDGHGGILMDWNDFCLIKGSTDDFKDNRYKKSVLDGMFENIYGNKFYSLDLINVVK